MIQNILINTLTPLKNTNEINSWENRPFTTVWPEYVQRKTGDVSIASMKKKRVRTAFTTEQLRTLEKTYRSKKYIDSISRAQLAHALNISTKCIKIWFQNRRMKEKRESSESSCDSSNETVENITPTVPDSTQLQVTPDQYLSKQPSQFFPYINSEHTNQLPTSQNTNYSPLGSEDMQAPNSATYFYNDNNVYPTHYYPMGVDYLNTNGNGFRQYGSENNNGWDPNQ